MDLATDHGAVVGYPGKRAMGGFPWQSGTEFGSALNALLGTLMATIRGQEVDKKQSRLASLEETAEESRRTEHSSATSFL